MIRAALLFLVLSLPTSAGTERLLFVDGEFLGTLAQEDGLRYFLGTGHVVVNTREGVYGCKRDLVFRDRFKFSN